MGRVDRVKVDKWADVDDAAARGEKRKRDDLRQRRNREESTFLSLLAVPLEALFVGRYSSN
jgi:hypothetical protein